MKAWVDIRMFRKLDFPCRVADVYERVTAQIVAALENGVRPWHQPWNAAHAAGRIGGFAEAQWDAAYADILAGSDVIRYVNLGNPEAILISDERVVQRAMVESGVPSGKRAP